MLVIGNGESRKNIDIDSITAIKIGCNAILRDHKVRHLICVDRRMMNEAIEKNYNQDSLIYTRKDWYNQYQNNKNIRVVPDLPYAGMERADDPFNWGSGPYAILLACLLTNKQRDPDPVRIIGFDLYGIDDKVNNVYKDTDNYDLGYKKAVDPRYWIYQIDKIIGFYTNVNFEFYNLENWMVPKTWKKPNVLVDDIKNLPYNN